MRIGTACRFRAEMTAPEASRTLDLPAALSTQANVSMGGHCEHEAGGHRSVLHALLEGRGARFAE